MTNPHRTPSARLGGRELTNPAGRRPPVLKKRPGPPGAAVVRAWVAHTRAAQGLLPVINDPVVIAKLIKLFRLAGDERLPL